MSVSAKEQAKAQNQEDMRNPDVDVGPSESKPWSGIQPRYMSVNQENRSRYDLGDVGKPEQLRGNKMLQPKPSANEYNRSS